MPATRPPSAANGTSANSSPAYRPTQRGFDHQYGLWFGMIDYFTHMRDEQLDWHRDDQPCHDEGYSTTSARQGGLPADPREEPGQTALPLPAVQRRPRAVPGA